MDEDAGWRGRLIRAAIVRPPSNLEPDADPRQQPSSAGRRQRLQFIFGVTRGSSYHTKRVPMGARSTTWWLHRLISKRPCPEKHFVELKIWLDQTSTDTAPDAR